MLALSDFYCNVTVFPFVKRIILQLLTKTLNPSNIHILLVLHF